MEYDIKYEVKMTGIILSLFLIQSFEKRIKEWEVEIKNIDNCRESDFAKPGSSKTLLLELFQDLRQPYLITILPDLSAVAITQCQEQTQETFFI